LAAERFTVADLCVASVLNWARPAHSLMAAHPLTHQWIVRCMERPAQLAVKALGRG
jgi:glutathione S-transferase